MTTMFTTEHLPDTDAMHCIRLPMNSRIVFVGIVSAAFSTVRTFWFIVTKAK